MRLISLLFAKNSKLADIMLTGGFCHARLAVDEISFFIILTTLIPAL